MARSSLRNPLSFAKEKFERSVYKVLTKYGYPPMGRRRGGHREFQPPYEREVNPQWLINVSRNQSLINNSIEEKVQQSFRRGFTGWEKAYEAKCTSCGKEFQSLQPFKEQLGPEGENLDDEDIDFDDPRPCPDCDEMSYIKTPDPDLRDHAKQFFQTANMRDKDDVLAPEDHSSIGQTFLEVCEEIGRDIQTFDDGWMIFERAYTLNGEGSVHNWTLEEVYRTPPYLMRYSVDDQTGKIGGEYWACLECRQNNPENYKPNKKPGQCRHCDNRTYEVFAYQLDDIMGDPDKYFVRGEFAHGSEYMPSFLYGYSPILSIWQEARTLENMDSWYQEAYEKRRAPRGAIVIGQSNSESVRAWNTEQMEKLNSDPNHIPTLINDSQSDAEPLKWVSLLEDPASMQHMEMRDWFKDRISAKYGVTQVLQTGGAQGSGMSQSLEIVVANRSFERLQSVFNDVFIPAMLGQLKLEGWTRELAPPEEEDEQAEAQLEGRHLNNLQVAQQLGLDAEWTEEDKAKIKPGKVEEEEEEEGGGGMGGLFGSEPAGQTSPSGGRPEEPEERGGAPNQPRNPTTDDPYQRGSVTSGSGGYSSASYGGGDDDEDPEILDYLEELESDLRRGRTETRSIALQSACEKYVESDIGPSLETLRSTLKNSEKTFQDLRKQASGWEQDYTTDRTVRLMYEVLKYEEQ